MDHILITHLKARRTAMDLTTPAVINRFLILDYLNVGFGVAVNLHSKNDVRLSQFNFQYRGREYSLIFTEAPAYAILLVRMNFFFSQENIAFKRFCNSI